MTTPLLDDKGQPLLTAEQHKALKLMEAMQERERIERLRKAANERWRDERKWGQKKDQHQRGEGSVY